MTRETHSIRLAGPWFVDWVGPEDVPSLVLAIDKCQFPMKWSEVFGSSCGTARFTRKFNQPTNLTDHHRVWLSIPEYSGMLSIELNDRVLAILPEDELPVQVDITPTLKLHNRLALEITYCPTEGNDARKTDGSVELLIVESEASSSV